MSANPKSNRQYVGKFNVSKTGPKHLAKDLDEGTVVTAETLSMTLPYSEARKLANQILNAESKKPQEIDITVYVRKTRKSDGLHPATITFYPKKSN